VVRVETHIVFWLFICFTTTSILWWLIPCMVGPCLWFETHSQLLHARLIFCWRVLIELNTPPRVYNTHTHCAPTTYELNRGSKYQTYLLIEKLTIRYILLFTLCIFLGLYTLFNILVFSLVSYDESVLSNYSVVYSVPFLWWNTLDLPPSYPICVQ
jgi:hypothetical protein